MQQEKQKEKLKCPRCSFHGIYYREVPEKHYKCKKCGFEFNLEGF